ncbi:MAG: flagellar protein FlaG [Kiloniellales bacterium]|nr:flagellar protein FlaG [Kiloniellales bacterium]
MTVAEATLAGSAAASVKRTQASARVEDSRVREAPARPATAEQVAPSTAGRPSAGASSQSRLAFDQELSRVFVEIVDSDSGEVVQRFPPEQIVRYFAEISDAAAEPIDTERTGLVLDQLA